MRGEQALEGSCVLGIMLPKGAWSCSFQLLYYYLKMTANPGYTIELHGLKYFLRRHNPRSATRR